jgi:hypothetical protein
VLDIGGRDINGTCVDLFAPECRWEVVDLTAAPNVTWVGDILDYYPDRLFDVVLHLEVAEHAAEWPDHLRVARDCVVNGGVLIFTAAGPERAPHSAVDGGPLREGEHYAAVDPGVLSGVLRQLFGWSSVHMTTNGADVRAVARR